MRINKLDRASIKRENAYYSSMVNKEFQRIKSRPKTHVIQMETDEGIKILTKPDSIETTLNTLKRYKRFLSNVTMVEVQKEEKE